MKFAKDHKPMLQTLMKILIKVIQCILPKFADQKILHFNHNRTTSIKKNPKKLKSIYEKASNQSCFM